MILGTRRRLPTVAGATSRGCEQCPPHDEEVRDAGCGSDHDCLVRAAEGEAVLTHRRRRTVHLVEVAQDAGAPILKRYALFAVSATPHVDVNWRAPLARFSDIADRYPVFRIDTR
jgi:hypothetical protein